jgi:hypothetical protein
MHGHAQQGDGDSGEHREKEEVPTEASHSGHTDPSEEGQVEEVCGTPPAVRTCTNSTPQRHDPVLANGGAQGPEKAEALASRTVCPLCGKGGAPS